MSPSLKTFLVQLDWDQGDLAWHSPQEPAALCPSFKEGTVLCSCSANPSTKGGRALLLQQGLFEPSPGLVRKFQSCCPFVPTRTMARGSKHRANRAPSVQQLEAETLLQSLQGLEPWRICLPEPGLSAPLYKGGIDLYGPDPWLVQSSEAPGAAGELGLVTPMGMCRAFLPNLCICLSPVRGASVSG